MPKSTQKPLINAITITLGPGFLVGCLHIAFTYSGFYRDSGFGWIDIPLHLVGGACVSFAAGIIIAEAIKRKALAPLPPYFFMFCLVAVASLVGIAWEFYEFLADRFDPVYLRQPSLSDTMKDLADDLNGALVTALILKYKFGNILTRKDRKPR